MAMKKIIPKALDETESLPLTDEEEAEIALALQERLGLTEDEWSTFIYSPNEFSHDEQKDLCKRIAKNLRVPEEHFRFGLGAGLEKSKRLSHKELRFLASKWAAD